MQKRGHYIGLKLIYTRATVECSWGMSDSLTPCCVVFTLGISRSGPVAVDLSPIIVANAIENLKMT